MKQVIQNYKTGELKIEEVPAPIVRPNTLLVKTVSSLISAGTERTKIETARMSLVEKAISRLDLVKIALNNIKQEGLIFTLKKALNKLDMSISLGYSCVGEVIEVGDGVLEFKIGNKVACVGENYATHCEINSIPEDFAVTVPENVDFDEASFVGFGAIALNSVEIAQTREGERVAVIGLGLIGQIVAQILKAKGCKVLGIELDEEKIFLAKQLGLDAGASPLKDDIATLAMDFSGGLGVDVVIIVAASKNNLPIEMAGKIARNKGRSILVGAMPIIIPRKEYYEKELVFIISRGFGAGLYHKEEKDKWYPYNYKPITVKENMQNFLLLLSDKKVDVKPLITHRFNLSDAKKAYKLLRTKNEKYLGIVFEYDIKPLRERKIPLPKTEEKRLINIGFVGAGSYAQGYLLPVLKRMRDVNLVGVATATGINAKNVARKFGFTYCTTDYNEILNDEKINCVFIVTRHNLHAKLVIEALKKGKNVFVEKPLCLNEEELKEIISVYKSQVLSFNSKLLLMVGFNRRFSPFIQEAKRFFEHRFAPLVINYRINAGYLPPEHWVHNPQEGGGRIIGEVCHFVDLLEHLVGAPPAEVLAVSLNHQYKNIPAEDNVLITLKFADGSIGAINYNSIGDISFPRERLEIFGDNSVVVMDNFKSGIFSRGGITKKMRRFTRDMGHKDELKSFINSLLNGKAELIPFREIVLTTLATFKIIEALGKKSTVKIDIGDINKGG